MVEPKERGVRAPQVGTVDTAAAYIQHIIVWGTLRSAPLGAFGTLALHTTLAHHTHSKLSFSFLSLPSGPTHHWKLARI